MLNISADKRWIYCDVDGTLILWGDKTPGVPRSGYPNINEELVLALKQWKCRTSFEDRYWLIVWSGEGEDHAKWAVEYCDLQMFVDRTLAKPQVIIDDQPELFSEDRLLGKLTHYIQV